MTMNYYKCTSCSKIMGFTRTELTLKKPLCRRCGAGFLAERNEKPLSFEYENGEVKIYVLVEVTYDYYRYQKNLCASTNKQDLIDYYNKIEKSEDNEIYSTKESKFMYPELRDDYKSEDEALYERDNSPHYWIQEL